MFSFGTEKNVTDDEKMYKSPTFKRHAHGVVNMVDTAVGLLEKGDMDTLVAALKDLGAKHVAYGVEEGHYPVVGQALLSTLEAALGDAFTEPVKEAWAGVYGVISAKMLEGAMEVTATNADATAKADAAVSSFPMVPLAVGVLGALCVGRIMELV